MIGESKERAVLMVSQKYEYKLGHFFQTFHIVRKSLQSGNI